MKVGLVVYAAIAAGGLAAQAGEMVIPRWPGDVVPQEVTSVPVMVEGPWWVWVKDLDELVIRLLRQSAHEYEGCIGLVIETHGSWNVDAEFIPTGAVPGDYSCWLTSSVLRAPESLLGVCVTLKTQTLPPAAKDVRVGTVKLKFSPRL
jgi:hypothetical protein